MIPEISGRPAARSLQRTRRAGDDHRMLDVVPAGWLHPRVTGRPAALALLALRLVVGVFLVGVGIGKFTDRASEIADFRHYGVPLPEVAVSLAGVVEIVGGLCVIVGFLVRPAAAIVALNLLVALLTAGVTDGGTFHLVVGPAVMVAMVVLVVTGAPAPSVDFHTLRRRDAAALTRTTPT
jgi:putative oxidoreductase